MKLTKNHKIIIGVLGLGVLAYATKKYWMPKKKETKIAGVNTQSTPTSSSTTNTNATTSSNSSKRNSIIAELKKQSLQSDPTAEQPSDDFYKNYSDRELEVLLIISKMDKDGASMNKINSEAEARKITAKYGTTPEELGNVMTKMFENAFSSMGMGKKQTPPKK